MDIDTTTSEYTDPFKTELEEAMRACGEEMPSAEAKVEPARGRGNPSGRTKIPFKPYVSRQQGDLGPGDMYRFNEMEMPESFAGSYKHEKWQHRIIAYLKSQCMSNKEIAEQTGYSYTSVCQILQLPWVKDVILDEIRRAGREEVQEMLQASAVDSIHTMIQIRDSDKSKDRDKLTAAQALLNRLYGNPTQPITHSAQLDVSSLSDQELSHLITNGRSN